MHKAELFVDSRLSLGRCDLPMLWFLFRTYLNGWLTASRMQTFNNLGRHLIAKCPFCKEGEDSLEHFARCYIVHEIFMKFGAPLSDPNNMLLDQFMSLDPDCNVEHALLKRVQALSCCYAIYNTLTHHPAHLPPLTHMFCLMLPQPMV